MGGQLVKLLVKENAKMLISDVNEERVLEIAKTYKAEVVDSSNWLDLEMDIYAPCAFGATLNGDTIPELRCQIIAGGANNQLEDEELHARMLQERDIVYAPDFLINSGGIINVYLEYTGNYQRELAYQRTEDIYQICLKLLERAEIEGVTTHQAALQMAKDRISAMGKVKLSFKAQ